MNTIDDGSANADLLEAVYDNNPATIDKILRAGCGNVKTAARRGNTLLHVACARLFSECEALLLHHGADPNLPDEHGQTPLLYASATIDDEAFVRPLLDHGANPVVTDKDGRTALHIAAWEFCPKIVQLLLRKGAAIDLRDSLRRTALHYAVSGCSEMSVRSLLKAGANPHFADFRGDRPLHLAAIIDYRGIAMALLDAGADLNGRNKDGKRPIELTVRARTGWGIQAAQVILERGAMASRPLLEKLLRNILRRASFVRGSDQLVELLLGQDVSTDVLTDHDCRIMVACNTRMNEVNEKSGLHPQTIKVLRLLANRRQIPPHANRRDNLTMMRRLETDSTGILIEPWPIFKQIDL